MGESTARALSARDLVDLWDLASAQPSWARPLVVLAVASPGSAWSDLAALPIGARDRRLLDLHERTFGPALRGLVRCPACNESIELTLDARDLRVPPPPERDEYALREGGVSLRFRLADTTDLAAASTAPTLAEARARILERCVLEALREGEPVAAAALPEAAVDALQRAMMARDPQAEVLVEVTCPSCRHAWQTLFEIAAMTLAAVRAQAQRLLDEVHALARAYGWTEDAVLSLSARRRRHYLERVNA